MSGFDGAWRVPDGHFQAEPLSVGVDWRTHPRACWKQCWENLTTQNARKDHGDIHISANDKPEKSAPLHGSDSWRRAFFRRRMRRKTISRDIRFNRVRLATLSARWNLLTFYDR